MEPNVSINQTKILGIPCFVHGSDIRLSFSKLPLIRIHIIWPTKLIYAKQEESFLTWLRVPRNWLGFFVDNIDYYKENKTEVITYDMRDDADDIFGLGVGCNGLLRIILQSYIYTSILP